MATPPPAALPLLPPDIREEDLRGAHSGASVACLHGHTMGTHYTLLYQEPPAARSTGAVQSALDRAFSRVIAQMSHYDPGSELSRINRSAPGTAHRLSDDFFRVLSAALALSEATGGLYHPNLGALSAAYGYGPEPDAHVGIAPLPPTVAEPWRHIRLDPVAKTLVHDLDRLHLDLSSIAKGYALDLAAERLRELGLRDFLLEIGGEFLAQGCKPDAHPWWVELASPPHLSHLPRLRLGLTRHALATSGIGEWASEDAAKTGIHHLLHPDERAPTRHGWTSVTVLAETCMMADAYATALYVMGAEKGIEFADRSSIAAVFAGTEGYVFSREFEKFKD